jgi:hypothetical protein
MEKIVFLLKSVMSFSSQIFALNGSFFDPFSMLYLLYNKQLSGVKNERSRFISDSDDFRSLQ